MPLAAKWKAIGMALRIKTGELNKIKSSCQGDPGECLTEVLTKWLQLNYDVEKYGKPTWQKLVEVVRDPAGGGDPALADSIANEHPG